MGILSFIAKHWFLVGLLNPLLGPCNPINILWYIAAFLITPTFWKEDSTKTWKENLFTRFNTVHSILLYVIISCIMGLLAAFVISKTKGGLKRRLEIIKPMAEDFANFVKQQDIVVETDAKKNN